MALGHLQQHQTTQTIESHRQTRSETMQDLPRMKEKSTLSSSANSRGDNVLSTDNDDEDYVEVNDASPITPPTLWRHQD